MYSTRAFSLLALSANLLIWKWSTLLLAESSENRSKAFYLISRATFYNHNACPSCVANVVRGFIGIHQHPFLVPQGRTPCFQLASILAGDRQAKLGPFSALPLDICALSPSGMPCLALFHRFLPVRKIARPGLPCSVRRGDGRICARAGSPPAGVQPVQPSCSSHFVPRQAGTHWNVHASLSK